MINPDKILAEISQRRLELDEGGLKKGQLTKLKARISFLHTIMRYLESDPSNDFVLKEIQRVNGRIQKLYDGFAHWEPGQTFDNDRKKLAFYLKECDVPKLRLQLRALRFISDN